ncbi:MAG: hypothetical protein H0U04_01440 [Rubrobacter sp.]|nr:hypothetical protein [Rubrobacter sp.]
MILYRLNEGQVYQEPILYRPRTCFLMTQLGEPVPEEVVAIRRSLKGVLNQYDIDLIDADSEITGGDFLIKIWLMLAAVPLAVAVVHEDMKPSTLSNIFYEIGLAQALGKESIVIKTDKATIPSDFIRTEYIKHDGNFERRMHQYINKFLRQGEWYELLADNLERNPLLSLDYLRRAFLITGEESLKENVTEICETLALHERARNSVESLLARF